MLSTSHKRQKQTKLNRERAAEGPVSLYRVQPYKPTVDGYALFGPLASSSRSFQSFRSCQINKMKLRSQGFEFIHLRRFGDHLIIGCILLWSWKIIENAVLMWHQTPCNLAHVSLPYTAKDTVTWPYKHKWQHGKEAGRLTPAILNSGSPDKGKGRNRSPSEGSKGQHLH